MQKVVVTGGSGKLGRYVIRELLDHGYSVYNMDRTAPTENSGARYFQCDLQRPDVVYDLFGQIRPDSVVHLAANPHPQGFARHEQFMQNVGLTHVVFQAAGDFAVKRVVYGSSEQANGWSSVGHCPPLPFDEDAMTPPASAYSLSKLVGEQIADGCVAQHPETSVVSLRLNYVQDPEHYSGLREWLTNHRPNRQPNLWAYIDARDAASAVRAGLEAELTGHRVYMVAAEDSLLTGDLSTVVKSFFPEAEIAEGATSAVDCRRIYEELGWRALHTWRASE